MDRQRFEDDSSAALNLGHGWQDFRQRQESENAAYRKGILDAGLVGWLISYLKADPETRDLQPADMENLAIDRYLSIRGGAHERVKTYVGRGMELRAAIMKAESDLTMADEAEEFSGDGDHGEGSLDEKGPWSERKIAALMKAPVEPRGSGSKSKSYKSRRVPDAPMVEQALRRGMMA